MSLISVFENSKSLNAIFIENSKKLSVGYISE